MWTRFMQAAAVTSMLYLVVGMSTPPVDPPIVKVEVANYLHGLLSDRTP